MFTLCNGNWFNRMSGGASNAGNNEEWPTKTVEIVVPFSAGGDTDFNARY